jgi:hypothetical protein
MNDKAPVEKGERFESIRTDEPVVVVRAQYFGTVLGWSAQVETHDGVMKWLTCSKDGIKGYRRVK